MVEMCEEWNSLSVKRHSRQVLPTPESPISSSRNSTSYCFAMAGAGGAHGCGGRRAQPRSAAAIAARACRGTPRAARRKAGRPPRRSPSSRSAGKRGAAGAQREERAAATPARPFPCAAAARRGGGVRAPESRDPKALASRLRAPLPQGARPGRGATPSELFLDLLPSPFCREPNPRGNIFVFFCGHSEWVSWRELPPSPPRPSSAFGSHLFSPHPILDLQTCQFRLPPPRQLPQHPAPSEAWRGWGSSGWPPPGFFPGRRP